MLHLLKISVLNKCISWAMWKIFMQFLVLGTISFHFDSSPVSFFTFVITVYSHVLMMGLSSEKCVFGKYPQSVLTQT